MKFPKRHDRYHMASPAQQDGAARSAEVVGHAFAWQYYTILHQSPELVFRFYQDTSKLGRPDDDGDMGSTNTMDAINEKIQSYGTSKADIKSIDAQESYNSGVIGYFVLNDIFRYVDDDYHYKGNEDLDNGVAAPITEDLDPPPVQEIHISDQVEEVNGGEVYNPSENGEVVEEEEPVAEVVDEVQNESLMVVESNSKVEEVTKKSYASIVKVTKENVATTPPAPPRSMPKMQEQQVTAAPNPPSVVETPVYSPYVAEDGNYSEVEGDSHSVYVKNLPLNATTSMLEEAFKRFGAIKSDGIQVRSNKGFCFGFVEFEVSSAAQNAIEASPITIGGRQAGIEKKKSTNSRGSNHSRFPPGRGIGFRNEGGTRGRGNYGGGRGYGRSDTYRSDFSNRGNSRGFQNRGGDGYQRNNHIGGAGGGQASHDFGRRTPGVCARQDKVMEECVASTPSLSPPSPVNRRMTIITQSWTELHFNVTPAVLEEAFKSSGSIKRGTVQVSSNKVIFDLIFLRNMHLKTTPAVLVEAVKKILVLLSRSDNAAQICLKDGNNFLQLCHSISVRNLCLNATPAVLEKASKRFGSI
ncbi:hypothetical protein Nepgr_029784 [Nepenthes gracilis]|uniref:Uncharacterized protein n=1 Tax=Nepenthes gracilis TaxID=150966 RepID=A0AAD3TEY8_NEPGR|nr:hypothetical protein Nepgr_029784 [Nepenthes gracilis]